METLIAFAIACAVTLFFVRGYVKGLGHRKDQGNGNEPAASVATDPCPRCGHPVARGTSFCGGCGAPMDLWRIHRATVAEKPSGEGGEKEAKPRPVINASLCIGCGTCVDVCPEAGTLALVGGKAILAEPARCVGHANCIDVCPTSAITLAFGDTLQTVTVPRVNEEFETNVAGVYIVGELGGMGLIKTAINEGRMVVDHIQKKLATCGGNYGGGDGRTPETAVDLIVAGAGPAGLSASLSAVQYKLSYLTFDQGEVASTIRNYPRHKFLMAEPVQMPLYGSLYIADSTKETLLSVWENIIANTGVQVRTNERVDSIQRREQVLEVATPNGRYYGRHVVLAMGKRGTPRRLGVAGEELSKVAYRLIEAETYEGQDILVVGGGDSAIEGALALSRAARNQVTLSYRKDDFSRARVRNREALAAAEEKRLIQVARGSTVGEIREDSVLLSTKTGETEVPNSFVFVMIGGESPEGFLRKTGVEIVEKTVGI